MAAILPREQAQFNKELTRSCKELAHSNAERARSCLELNDSV